MKYSNLGQCEQRSLSQHSADDKLIIFFLLLLLLFFSLFFWGFFFCLFFFFFFFVFFFVFFFFWGFFFFVIFFFFFLLLFFFFQKVGFDISCKLSPKETICMKFQSLFSGKKNQKNMPKCRLLTFLPRVLGVNVNLKSRSVLSLCGWLAGRNYLQS